MGEAVFISDLVTALAHLSSLSRWIVERPKCNCIYQLFLERERKQELSNNSLIPQLCTAPCRGWDKMEVNMMHHLLISQDGEGQV